MPEREKFRAQMEEKLNHLKERIESTKAKAETKGQDFIKNYEQDLAKLESKYDLARYKLSLLRSGSASAWGELREGFENAYHDLKDALSKAKEKL